jgi:hypothetical protein
MFTPYRPPSVFVWLVCLVVFAPLWVMAGVGCVGRVWR